MIWNDEQKETMKRQVAACLSREREVRRIVIFGSFLTSPEPHDVDVAVFQDSNESYLPLALKYRRLMRPIAAQLPVDVVPIRAGVVSGTFLAEVQNGDVVYER